MVREEGLCVRALTRRLLECVPQEEGYVSECFEKRACCVCASERGLGVCLPRKDGIVNM